VMFKEPCREIGTVTCFLGESKMENSIGWNRCSRILSAFCLKALILQGCNKTKGRRIC
jgi:hypothetical protein